MKAYFITEKDTFKKQYLENISKYCSIVYGSNNNDLNHELLLADHNDKIIIYDPDYAGWKFPDKIVSDTKNIKAIFLGTTDKSYIDLEMCSKYKIDVINIPKYATESVAEYLVMYMFTCAKKIPLQIKNNNKQEFEDSYLQMEIKNKKVGIIGLGNIGLRVAEMCHGIGMDVYYWNRVKKDVSYQYLNLSDLLKSCDVIYLCLSINDETKNIMTDDLLRNIKTNSIFISATGAQLFNEKVIEEKVKKNELFGYALELPNTKLNNYQGNVMVTSEYGWFTKEARDLRVKLWIESVQTFLRK